MKPQRALRLLHTADWHLGQTLHGHPRSYEHGCFLDWLLEQVERHAVDALLVAGDVFDVASPSAGAQASYFGFLAEARRRYPDLDVVVVGGNHDAAPRLDAARAVLDALRVHVVGGLPVDAEGRWDLGRLLVPLKGGAVWLAAVPFLRPKDLPRTRADAWRSAGLPVPEDSPPETVTDPIAHGHALVYAALAEAAAARRGTSPLVATGHAYVAGGALSELSERKIQQGNQQALRTSTFPPAYRYVALGHLHLAQEVESESGPHVRYSGSPIPLSMAELAYPHQVVLVDVPTTGDVQVRAARVPRFVELLRVPPEPRPLEEVLPLLAELPRDEDGSGPEAARPLLEARVLLTEAHPRLRKDVEAALEGAWARLVRIDITRPAPAEAPFPSRELDQLAPEDVFLALHRGAREEAPSALLMNAFRDLLEEVEREDRRPEDAP